MKERIFSMKRKVDISRLEFQYSRLTLKTEELNFELLTKHYVVSKVVSLFKWPQMGVTAFNVSLSIDFSIQIINKCFVGWHLYRHKSETDSFKPQTQSSTGSKPVRWILGPRNSYIISSGLYNSEQN